mmetsp:Transcript_28133/g.29327  ORF Transcript_28133/g.29327 Transcript_28133/m.29327 type:complete len:130 (+) Transcript_28133:20-409(+)
MGGDIKGGGLFIYESGTNPSQVYGDGLRVPRTRASLELDGLATSATIGKKKDFERGVITHIRSNATQHITWHSLFGGFRKSVIERYYYNFWWRVVLKRFGPLILTLWTAQVMSHRDYDANAYCYFYFSD